LRFNTELTEKRERVEPRIDSDLVAILPEAASVLLLAMASGTPAGMKRKRW